MKPILEEKNIKNNISIAVQRLLDGNLVIVPTETVYGLGADATNSMAVKKIFHIKMVRDVTFLQKMEINILILFKA